jgi:hypothetical protein
MIIHDEALPQNSAIAVREKGLDLDTALTHWLRIYFHNPLQ